MRPQNDMSKIRAVGGLCLAIGLGLFLYSVLLALYSLATAAVSHHFAQIWLPIFLDFVMGATLMSCGAQLLNLKSYTSIAIESVRLAWTTMVLGMILTGIAALWILPGLAGVAAFCLLALISIRGAIIRLS